MFWQYSFYQPIARPIGDQSIWVEGDTESLSGWTPVYAELVVRPLEYRHLLPTLFFQGEPTDFIEPSAPDEEFAGCIKDYPHVWPTPSFPSVWLGHLNPEDFTTPDTEFLTQWSTIHAEAVHPIEYRYSLPTLFYEPDDSTFEILVEIPYWHITHLPVRPTEYRHTLPSLFFLEEPSDLTTPDTEFLTQWSTTYAKAVYPTEYRHLLPYLWLHLNQTDYVEGDTESLSGWSTVYASAVEPTEYRHFLPTFFYELEDSVLVGTDEFPHWHITHLPVIPIEYRHLLPNKALFEYDPTTFEDPDSAPQMAWVRPTEQAVRPIEYRHRLPFTFFQDTPDNFLNPDAYELAWIRPTEQAVWPTEYKHLLPSWFWVVPPTDFLIRHRNDAISTGVRYVEGSSRVVQPGIRLVQGSADRVMPGIRRVD